MNKKYKFNPNQLGGIRERVAHALLKNGLTKDERDIIDLLAAPDIIGVDVNGSHDRLRESFERILTGAASQGMSFGALLADLEEKFGLTRPDTQPTPQDVLETTYKALAKQNLANLVEAFDQYAAINSQHTNEMFHFSLEIIATSQRASSMYGPDIAAEIADINEVLERDGALALCCTAGFSAIKTAINKLR